MPLRLRSRHGGVAGHPTGASGRPRFFWRRTNAMRNGQRPVWAALGLGLILALPVVPARADDEAIKLFNGKDLSGWSIFIRHDPKEDLDPRADPKGVFKVEDGVIHISGQEFGCLTTDKEFENYRVKLEFK